jgi:predicted ATPase/class 3 adenylate cyclase
MHSHEATRTLAFLFTDIEGSTALWESFPDAMAQSLDRHDEILRGAVEAFSGEVVKTTGDGFMAVFATARDGVRACLQSQLGLVGEPWNETGPLRVRMGLHAGDAVSTGGDYHGPAVNRTARVMAAGHGGQVLLSAVAADLVVDELPEGSTLLDLGEHRLKSLGRPERIFQLVHPGLPTDFPALATVHDRSRALPLEASTLIGRVTELATIEDRLRDGSVRLLTLVGPGGIGKTRLALRVASDLSPVFGDGVFFVDLHAARGAASVLLALARAVGLPDASEGSQFDELGARLANRRCLVVLDNFEQVTAAASTVSRLLDDCPGLTVLVTSREALNVRGEHRFPVPPLTLPDEAGRADSADALLAFEAIQLFVDRAQAIRPDFRLTDDNSSAVAEICRRLDGLPLAIELATARIGALPPNALRDRLGSRLTLLRGGARDLPERQQTLRATIDWSYELLDSDEQRLFELLSTFAGARVEAVETVTSSLHGRLEGLDALDGLASLVDKSLVRQVDGPDGQPRFVMLETIREYAAERLGELSDFGAAARRAHAEYFAELVRSHEVELAGRGGVVTGPGLAVEAENLRSAWNYWVEERDLGRLNGLVDGLWALYESQGWYGAAVALASDLLTVLATTAEGSERTGVESMLRVSRARALMAMEGFTSAVEAEYTEALELIDTEADRSQLFPILRSLGTFYNYRAEFTKGADIGRQIRALAEREDDPSMQVEGAFQLGSSLGFLGDLEAGTELLDTAIASFETTAYRPSRFRVGSDVRIPCLTTSAFLLWLLGYPDRSLERANRAVELALELEHPLSRAYALFHSGLLHLWRREPELVRVRALATLEIADDHDLPVWTATGTFLLGAARTDLGEVEEGLARIREGIGLYRDMRTPPVFWPMLLAVCAGACSKAGLDDEALSLVDEALDLVPEPTNMPLRPGLLVVKGDLAAAARWANGDDQERCYRLAFESAGILGARMPQLRAAASLYRLHTGRADDQESRRMLESVYRAFTEGFTTVDLVEARALLDA